jgi:uncharacterized protein Usg
MDKERISFDHHHFLDGYNRFAANHSFEGDCQVTEKGMAPDAGFVAQLAGFSLTTAEILYRLPDHPSLIQSYIWQEYDQAPRFPKLKTFLDFWIAEIEGKLFRVTVAHSKLIRPCELKLIGAELKVH